MGKIFRRAIVVALIVAIAVVPLAVSARTVPPPPQEEPVADIAVPAVISAPARPVATDASMEAALLAVRRIITIDDEIFTDFSYSSSFSNWETREGLIWHFNWSGDDASAFATVSADGTLLNYNVWHSGQSFGFAEISVVEALNRAEAFIRRAIPASQHEFFTHVFDRSTNIHSREFSFLIEAYVGSHAFPISSINIGVDKFTGEITSYFTSNIDPTRFNFERADNLISHENAIAAHAENIGMSLEYRSRFNFETNQVTIFPAYTKNEVGTNYISAITGEVVTYVFDRGAVGGYAIGMGGAVAAPQAEADESVGRAWASLSPAERAAVEQVAGFITNEQALDRLLGAMDLSGLDVRAFDDKHISLSRDFVDSSRFVYNVSLFRNLEWDAADDEIRSISGTVDATTGRVRAFNLGYHGTPFLVAGQPMSDSQIQAAVSAFLREMAPAELAASRLESRQAPSIGRFEAAGINNFNYIRMANGIPFRDNGISVAFNQVTGVVTNFSLNWLDNVSFPSISNVLTPEQALTRFVEQNGSRTIYITTGESNARLVYDFGSGLIDPFTGALIDFMGDPMQDQAFTPNYSDVIGHWSERYVMRLLDNGVYNWSGLFEPDRVMNEVEFVAYIMQIEQPWMARMAPQAFLQQRGIDFDASAGRQVTRQAAAKIIVEYLDFGLLAQQPQWFVYPFNDNVSDAFRGYITIAHMLGIVGGDTNGNFNANGNVTRGQAAVMLHNLIIARTAQLG